MTYTLQLVNGQPVYVDLDAAGNVITSPPPAPPSSGGGLDYPPGLGPTIGLVQGLPDGSEVVRPLAQFNNPGGFTDDGLIISDSLARCGRTRLAPGAVYTVQQGSLVYGLGQYLSGPGQSSSIIKLAGSTPGPAVTIINATGAYSQSLSAGLRGVTIDVSAAPAGSVGVQAGDIGRLQFYDVGVLLGTSGNTGWHFLNQLRATEQMHGAIYVQGIGNGVVFDVGGANTASGSFDRPSLDIYLNMGAGAGTNGVVFQNGAGYQGGRGLGIFGNMAAQPSAPGAVLTLTGQTPGGHPVQFANIGGNGNPSPLVLDVELDGAGSAPATIVLGASCSINAAGVLNFHGNGAFAASTGTQGSFKFQGPIAGDATLVQTPVLGEYDQPSGTYGTLRSNFGGVVTINPGAAVTGGILTAGAFAGQKLTIINASGANSYTFAAAGTSNVADGVADVIAANSAASYTWSTLTNLWYRG